MTRLSTNSSSPTLDIVYSYYDFIYYCYHVLLQLCYRAILILSIGITIAFILYSPIFVDIRRLLIYGICFIIIDSLLVLIPFLSIRSFLINKKKEMLKAEQNNNEDLRNKKYNSQDFDKYKTLEKHIEDSDKKIEQIKMIKTDVIPKTIRRIFLVLSIIEFIFGSIYFSVFTSKKFIFIMHKVFAFLNP
jgi:hypothetical protein